MEKLTQSNSKLFPEKWVEAHGDCLYRFALTRLRNPDLAENAVQETFLAALKSQNSFTGKSSERTWLVGILKHKIIDHFRKQYRQKPITDIKSDEQTIDSFFDNTMATNKPPSAWTLDTTQIVENNEFWAVFENCLQKLPQNASDAFSMRELDNIETEEICKILGVTATNLWVILHRARLQLKKCMETNWFAQ